MAVKESLSSSKRPRLSNDESSSQNPQSYELAVNINISNRTNQKTDNQESGYFDSDSDRYSELFDSFKDTNHLKELHCR